jgi:hypothetical protein
MTRSHPLAGRHRRWTIDTKPRCRGRFSVDCLAAGLSKGAGRDDAFGLEGPGPEGRRF